MLNSRLQKEKRKAGKKKAVSRKSARANKRVSKKQKGKAPLEKLYSPVFHSVVKTILDEVYQRGKRNFHFSVEKKEEYIERIKSAI